MRNILIAVFSVQVGVACTTVQLPGGEQGGSSPQGGSQTGGSAGTAGAGEGGSSPGGTGGTSPTAGTGGVGGDPGPGGAGGAGGNPPGGSGGQGGGGAGGGLEEPPEGPCGKIPEEGICLDKHTLQRCLIPTGQDEPQLVTQSCPAPKVCAKVGGGEAQCFLDPALCEPGSSRCLASNTKGVCDGAGKHVSSPCPGCKDSAVGPTCQTTSTTKISGAVDYEVRQPNAQFTDWSSTKVLAPAQGLLAISWRKVGATYEALDSTILDSEGAFSIQIASPPGPEDLVLFYAARPSPDGKSISFAVANPKVSSGEQDAISFFTQGQGDSLWSWSTYASDILQSPGGKLTITEDIGSGVVYVFDYLRYVHSYTEYLAGKPGKSMVIWIRPNTSWSCGACYVGYPTQGLEGVSFDAQILIPALKQDQSFWSGAVNAHELGHWVMDSYGVSPGEGGPHTLDCPTYPGQAWSEGWATAFSSLARGNSFYYDKQQGSFFWLDIDPAGGSSGAMWPKPKLSDGLYQQMSENEVAGLLWNLATKPSGNPEFLGTSKHLMDALRSKRMTVAPFLRGYQQHSWDISPGSCKKQNVKTYSETVPMLADYLDALACSGISASTISSALKAGQPSGAGYPYDPTAPLCK